MPSPVGHGLAALAAGWAVSGLIEGRRQRVVQVAILVGVGVAPDLDLLIGRHSRETHSIGAAIIVASLAAWQRWPVASSRVGIWTAVALAWLSHPLLDALAFDTAPPIGVMAFWPWSTDHVQTGWSVFGPISRRFGTRAFFITNLTSMARELVLLVPVVASVWWWRARTSVGVKPAP
jgi:membrane-bound metal-dependent hydrolase YbcI (DUF457 family)